MKLSKNLVATKAWVYRVALFASFTGLLAACADNTANNPNAANPPQPTVTNTLVTPAPQPTVTNTVVSPVPQPTVTQTVVSPVPQQTDTATTNSSGQPITDVVIITTNPNQQSLVNRRVQFTNVNVQNVIGDRTFWVGSNNNQRLFVVLAPNLDAGSAENKVVVKTGQQVNLTGVLQPMPSTQQAQQQWGLSATEAQALSNQSIYLQADRIQFEQAQNR